MGRAKEAQKSRMKTQDLMPGDMATVETISYTTIFLHSSPSFFVKLSKPNGRLRQDEPVFVLELIDAPTDGAQARVLTRLGVGWVHQLFLRRTPDTGSREEEERKAASP